FRTARIGGLCAAVCAVLLLLVQMRVQGNQLPEDTVMIVDSPPSAEFEIPAQATPAAAATVNAALAPAATTPDAEPAEFSEWDRRWWIDKASRILRGGAGVSPFDEMSELNGLPEEEIAK